MAQAITVYDHIAQNNRKTLLLIALFPVCLLITWFLVWWPAFYLVDEVSFVDAFFLAKQMSFEYLLPISAIAVIWMLISYCFGEEMMMEFAAAKPLEKKENRDVYNVVENTAIMAGLPMPKIYIIDDDSLNAFATGPTPKKAAIALTSGIIERLSKAELQGVVAHEMAHIGNRDIRLNMLIIIGLGIFESLGWGCFRLSRGRDNKLSGLFLLLGAVFFIFGCVVAPLIHLAISRKREFAADATGAKILHNSKALADALEKIAEDSCVEILDKQKNMAVACIASPFVGIEQLTSTHPPIRERIRRLRSM